MSRDWEAGPPEAVCPTLGQLCPWGTLSKLPGLLDGCLDGSWTESCFLQFSSLTRRLSCSREHLPNATLTLRALTTISLCLGSQRPAQSCLLWDLHCPLIGRPQWLASSYHPHPTSPPGVSQGKALFNLQFGVLGISFAES